MLAYYAIYLRTHSFGFVSDEVYGVEVILCVVQRVLNPNRADKIRKSYWRRDVGDSLVSAGFVLSLGQELFVLSGVLPDLLQCTLDIVANIRHILALSLSSKLCWMARL